MIYSWRGVGKTHVALGIAYAVAAGSSFLGWKATKPRGVLYLDGEIPANALQERLSKIGCNKQDLLEENLLLLTPDLQISKMPDLASSEGQQMIDELILPSTELIIIDNLSCFVRSGGRENDAESWLSIGQWALAKRAQGKSVLFIHHAGKSGNQRGTSKREDILDTVISLKHPSDYQWDNGAHFEKARHILGKNVKPFVAHLTQDGNKQKWQTTALAKFNKRLLLYIMTG
jgi:RecA-family ATPase